MEGHEKRHWRGACEARNRNSSGAARTILASDRRGLFGESPGTQYTLFISDAERNPTLPRGLDAEIYILKILPPSKSMGLIHTRHCRQLILRVAIKK